MVGYRTERFENFGWAAARSDDLLNWVPARMTGFMLWVLGGIRGSWAEIAEDAKAHKSPNAGWPEAAMARALNIALAGPRSYHGELRELPWVNQSGKRDIGATEIEASVRQLWRIWAALVILSAAPALLV
jgi:adenosylcobinamide-phosphate synthase